MDGFRRVSLNRKVLIRLIVITGGVGIIFLSLLAVQLGLDNDPGWGPRRLQILGAGIAIVFFGALYWITPVVSRWYEASFPQRKESIHEESTKLGRSFLHFKVIDRLNQYQWFRWVARNQTNIGLVLLGCCVLWVYIWVITVGRMDTWPSGRDYYWLLTQAFQKGQTYLLVDPNPELLKLQNPYDLQQRKGLDYLWDTTLYNGKYYLYWGPVPAVLGVLINFVTSRPVTDTGLVFSFILGTVLFSVLLLKKICQDYQFPSLIFWGGAISSAINIPLIWLLTHPTYYEVSISGGQFFMMTGFFLLYLAFHSSSLHKRYLFLSALAFGLAGGTRVNLLPSVIFLALIILWCIYVVYGRKNSVFMPMVVMVIAPLAILACSLAWYNYSRFGSIFEFGHRYQLSGLSLTADDKDQTSLTYIAPNLYTYLFRLPSLSGKFPFVTISWIKENMWPFFIHLPENYYYPEPVAGVLFVIPLLGFTAIVLIRLLWLLANGDISLVRDSRSVVDSTLFWFGFALFGSICIQLFILLIFVSSSLRYLFDITPALIVLSTMFVGYQIQSFENKPYAIKTILYLWLLTSALTVIAGFLIGFTGSQNNFLNKNPETYYQLFGWFSR